MADLKAIQVSALVVMKIIKHCSQVYPTSCAGSIVGMDVGTKLEVTNSFPFPAAESDSPISKPNIAYQNDMIKYLREVNVDANNVGWYTSANMGSFISQSFIETQYQFQKDMNERTVVLVNDVSRSTQGTLSLKAYRLSPSFMAAYKEGKFTTERYDCTT
jgi:translation initiation factor 3 subunit H